MVTTDTGRTIKYRVHLKGGNWLPYVTGYNENDANNGYAGILGREIDGVQMYIEDGYSPAPAPSNKAQVAVNYALSKVGYPYSQKDRDSGWAYDCSSLVYYAWKEAGVNISYNGSNTAAAEAQGLESAGKSVSINNIQPGDLIFYSYGTNGRYKNITHVVMYIGNGEIVEAANPQQGVRRGKLYEKHKIVAIGRP